MMSKTEDGPGIRAGRARTRRRWIVIGGVAIIVFGTDAVLHALRHAAPSGGYALAPDVAVGSAVLLLLVVLSGGWLGLRLGDELERRDSLVAYSAGFLFNVSAYMVWILLYLGRLTPPPAANWLFLSTIAAAVLAYGWTRVRRLV